MSRILVIDDDSGHRLILKSRLTENGHEPVLADSGAKGLVEARAQGFDAFMVAARLGKGIDGYEVCRRLKAMPERAHVPVLLFNDGSAAHDDPARAYEAGCDAYVTKPDLPALETVLRVHLRSKKRLEELSREVHALHEHIKRIQNEDRPRNGDHEGNGRDNGDHGAVLREIAAGRPDGIVVVDSEGTVHFADRGACDLLGGRLEGMHLGDLAPSSGLEAFARDARIEPREGFRFDLPPRKGRLPRSVHAVVVPLLVQPGGEHDVLRVVLFQDAGKRRLAADLLKVPEPTVPRAELGPLLEAAREVYRIDSLVGEGSAMRALRAHVVAAIHDVEPVVLIGERASGLERVARVVHFSGSRSGAFVHARCAARSKDALEADLFGTAKGVSPAAHTDRPGQCHMAQDGTLFLEDVGELPLELQARLLRLLDSGTIQRKGAQRPERLDLRVIASSATPLQELVDEGSFMPELCERIARHTLNVPALIDHREDIEECARFFMSRYGGINRVRDIDADVFELLRGHNWPGSLSELEGVIQTACELAVDGVIGPEHIPRTLRTAGGRGGDELIPKRRASSHGVEGTHAIHDAQGHELRPRPSGLPTTAGRTLDVLEAEPVSFEIYERQALLRAIDESGGDKIAAAKLLGVGKSTLYRKLKQHGIK
ncbi:MAG: sigma 54-interacting transcriptional regulator [Planctomycetes bacterium]|nr:sigma 54-interacting transcriptional regulator [Planctomycetota bacterium]